ncbi:hypothetical protein BDV38DRAFT_58309 [Aspergillus pseudotamarii]|uniref:BTB domain-containing protein n=1 Tax=Aspergillus pseudotamarii TaxID=132259 RepID=A0A5N6SYS7_ASPPS|nr:uncharacterized protein BDV38DRAFT_58309 [Aspergillus pseudotamarii]KAE8139057.1 hypothetical protein BDV38DRAFT_58309 [Aspergillus pseudotamarii]
MSSPLNHGWIPQDTITITPQSDLTIQIDQYSRQDGEKVLERTALMHVKRDVLVNSSRYFQTMMGGRWAESKGDSIVLEDDTVRSMEIWLRSYHCTLDAILLDDISVADIWHVILASDKYQFDRDELQEWFIRWFRNATAGGLHHDSLANKLMLPCYAFDYAQGFQVLTRSLAYEEKGHIMEINPIENVRLHLPPRIIQQVNAAKGRLRNVLNRELFAKINSLIENASCGCKDETVFNYLRELGRIKVQPMEEGSFSRVSIQCYLTRLRFFDHERMLRGISKRRCFDCNFNWMVGVEKAIKVTAKYFDGLCLDCMKTTVKADKEYWDHINFSERYDAGCRITHGEPTHYFSLMARRDKRGLVAD